MFPGRLCAKLHEKEVSSPVSSPRWSCRRPAPSSAGRSRPQRPPRNKCIIPALRAKQGNQAFLRDSVPGARKRLPNLPRFACADRPALRPSTRSVPGWGTPPLALAAPAGVGQGQGVFVSKHSTAIQKRRNHPHEQHRHHERNQQRHFPSHCTQAADRERSNRGQRASPHRAAGAGHCEALTAYLTAMGRFHNYSFGNILEIARQKPDATRVAGLYAWNQLGRKVKKGEKGIRILAPVIGINGRRMRKPRRTSPIRIRPFWSDSAPPMSSM